MQKDSLFWFVSKENVRSIPELPSKISEQFLPLFETLLKKGIYLAPNAYEVGFCSLAHDEKVLEDLLKRFFADQLYLDTTQKNGFQFFYWILVAKILLTPLPQKLKSIFLHYPDHSIQFPLWLNFLFF